MRKRLGVITPTISPFKNGNIDSDAVKVLLSFLKKSRANGIFPCGSTGCAPLMDTGQHISMIKAYSESKPSNMKTFAGIGRNSVRETLEVANAAIKAGANALVLVTPYYIRLNANEIIRYYDKLLDMIDFDVIAYNIPQFTGNRINLETFEKIRSRHRNLVGIKDSSMDLLNFEKLCRMLPEDVIVFQGEDNLLMQSMMLGASGGICGTTNFDDTAVKLFNAYVRGEKGNVKKYQAKVSKIMDTLSSTEFPLAYHYLFYHKLMHMEKINALPPFYRNDAAYVREVRQKLRKLL